MTKESLGELVKSYRFRPLHVTSQRNTWIAAVVFLILAILTIGYMDSDRCNVAFCLRAHPSFIPISMAIASVLMCVIAVLQSIIAPKFHEMQHGKKRLDVYAGGFIYDDGSGEQVVAWSNLQANVVRLRPLIKGGGYETHIILKNGDKFVIPNPVFDPVERDLLKR